MGLGLMIFLLFCLFVAGAWGVIAISQAKARHRQEMMDLARGRKPIQNAIKEVPTHAVEPPSSLTTPPRQAEVRGPMQVLSNGELHTQRLVYEQEQMQKNANSPWSHQAYEREILAAMERNSQNKTKPESPRIFDSDAVLRRAQRIYKRTIAEAKKDNQRGQGSGSRQPGPCTMNISYVDAKGAWSHRNIAPYKSGATNARFDAWCDTQKTRRTFYFERIQCGTDLRTGRQLSQAGVFQLIHPSRSIPPGLE